MSNIHRDSQYLAKRGWSNAATDVIRVLYGLMATRSDVFPPWSVFYRRHPHPRLIRSRGPDRESGREVGGEADKSRGLQGPLLSEEPKLLRKGPMMMTVVRRSIPSSGPPSPRRRASFHLSSRFPIVLHSHLLHQPYSALGYAHPSKIMATRGSKRKAGEEELVELPEDESLDE